MNPVWNDCVEQHQARTGGMAYLGFHASHEQIDPKALLDAVQLAEQAGFAAAMCSDHFSP